jgi:TRAP-type mannitol/chloroaromatic compound transport system permease small subunit
MNVLLKLSSLIDTMNRTIGRIFAYILLPMTILTAFEVFRRYVLNSPTIWAWELILQIWGFMLMACGGYCYLKGGLVRVDVVYNNFNKNLKTLIGIITAITVLICMGLSFKYGWTMAFKSFLRNERISSVWVRRCGWFACTCRWAPASCSCRA